ncbi:YdcF family protein [Priestia megaterium]|uniref:YdcF family protein n=1 Tax=Priestia megaterium TaxID=1404 RepID=UPI00159C7BE6|nr:YdcF family protein [Priestia megaterium]
MRKNKRKILRISILIVGLGIIFFAFAGKALVVNEKPVKSDAIIVLSGDGDRIEKGIELYKKGYASHLILSNGQENNLYNQAKNSGIPIHSIILENHATSTTENAEFTKKVMIKYNFQSAIVVSSNYHMKRVEKNFDKEFKDTRIQLTFCSSGSHYYNPKRWWETSLNRKITYTEYIKLIGNYFGFNGKKPKELLRNFK